MEPDQKKLEAGLEMWEKYCLVIQQVDNDIQAAEEKLMKITELNRSKILAQQPNQLTNVLIMGLQNLH